MSLEKFTSETKAAFTFTGKTILLGGAAYDKKPVPGLQVSMPLSMVNRHGLITGATGTGKTKSVQHFAECLSAEGVGVLLMDIKGDISGMAKPGTENPKITERMKAIGAPWSPAAYPVELMTISNEKGLRLRATVSEFGPVLYSKILELNENQQGAVAVIFKYCDDKKWPLLDLKDVRAVLQHISSGPGKDEVEKNYGAVSAATIGVIQRKLLELEQQGGDLFFGEKSFEVEDLLRKTPDGRGIISILRLTDLQDRPRLFSTFMLCLLAEVYNKFPEMGDRAAPKLAIVLDEAHLVFNEATKTLLQQLETIIKLIRSKGVGIYFCTQSPTDIPESILGQLGLKIQHALRAFTAKDRKDIKLVAENFPETEHYQVDRLITEMGIGEAMVCSLDEKGTPLPLVHTWMCAPQSRMDVLTPAEQDEVIASSSLAASYNENIDRESAYEMLKEKIQPAAPETAPVATHAAKQEETAGNEIVDTIKTIAGSSMARTVAREITRGLFGVLMGKPSRRR